MPVLRRQPPAAVPADPDRFQRKPGIFRLDECAGCRLVFQNPRLSSRGLDYYYGDFYEGMGAQGSERYYGLGRRGKARQARRVTGLAEPRHWLDVGGGNGSFCEAAATIWPGTRFEVLDRSRLAQDAVATGRPPRCTTSRWSTRPGTWRAGMT